MNVLVIELFGKKHFSDECEAKYSNVVDPQVILNEAHRLRSIANAERLDGNRDPKILLEDILEAKGSLTSGTSNGGGTLIVNEHLKSLPLTFWFWTLGVFRSRHAGEMPFPDAWRLILIFFIAKVRFPSEFKTIRGIALLDALAKLFIGVLISCMQRTMRPGAFHFACCFAYTKERCCMDVIFCLNTIITKIYEWRGRLDGFIFAGDILGAFDHCPVTSVAQAMREAGIACKTVACFLGLQIGLTVQPDFAKLYFEPCSFSGPVRQGGKRDRLGSTCFFGGFSMLCIKGR